MASNIKGQGKFKGFLLLHGEKLAISLIGLIALLLVYKSLSVPHLAEKYQAPKLQEQIRQTSSAIHSAEWPKKDSDLAKEVREAQPIGEKADLTVSTKLYSTSPQGFDTTIVAPTVLRTDPKLVNAVGVRATGGSGLFAFIDPEVRKKRDLERIQQAAEQARKDAEKAAKDAKAGPQKAGEGGPGGNRLRGPEGGQQEVFDKDHKKRRALEGTIHSLGVPLQGGERIERAYWAVVVAKVPIREQLKLYQDAFEKAKLGFDPTRDFPQYLGYQVQRSEVVPGKPLDWKPVPVYEGQHQSIAANKPLNTATVGRMVMDKLYALAAQVWAGMSPDVIDPRFSDYVLTFPLPPLVGRDWGSEATHPDIPLLADTPPLEDNTTPAAPAPTDKPAENDDSSAFSAASPSGPVPGPGAPGGFPGAMRPGGEGPGMPPGGRGFNPGMMMGRPGGERPGGPGAGPEGGGRSFVGALPAAAPRRASLPKGVDFLLLRFFDFTVEPGKKYKYRITLVLADPNANMLDTVLAPPVLDRRRQELQTAKAANRTRQDIRRIETWSDPSPTVGIPLSGNVRLVDVKLPATEKFNDEPSAKLLVESFDVDEKNNSIQAAKDKEFRRGSVANMVEETEYVGDNWIDTREGFKFVTGMTVVDIDGGKKLAKDVTSPGRVLVMGPSGDLYIHNEIDDKPAVDYHRMLFEKDDKHREGGPEGPAAPGRPPRGTGRPSR